jgi:hypothetical protein
MLDTLRTIAPLMSAIGLWFMPACSSDDQSDLFSQGAGGSPGTGGQDASSGAGGEGASGGGAGEAGSGGAGGDTGQGGAGGEPGTGGTAGDGGAAGTGGGAIVCDSTTVPNCFTPCTAADPQPCHCKASYGNSYCACGNMGFWDCGNPSSLCPEPGPKCYSDCPADHEGLWCGCDIGQGGVQQCGCTAVGGDVLKWQCGQCPANQPGDKANCMSSGLTCIYGSTTCVCQTMAWTCQG